MNADRLLGHYERIADAPDAIARLRRFILDLAVRGKLVEQNPNDEPASELLKRIEMEKARLVNAELIKSPKQLEAVERGDTEFCTPSSWCWTRLGKITSYIQRGKSPKYGPTDGPPVVSQKCVQWHGLDLDKARKITHQSLTTYENIRFLREGDLLWNSTGTGTIGRVIRIISPPERLVCDSHVTVVRCLLVSSEYIRTWLRTGNVYGLIEERADGSTNQVELTAQMALNQVVPLPPLAEQRRIVAKVDELMALCDRLEAARTEREATRNRLSASSLARLDAPDPDPATFRDHAAFALENLAPLTTRTDQIKALRQTILSLAVRGKLVEQDPNDEPASELLKRIAAEKVGLIKNREIRKKEALPLIEQADEPFPIPPSWVWSYLGNLFHLVTDGAHHTPRYIDRGISFLSVKDVSSGTINFTNARQISEDQHTELCKRCCPKKGDILLTKVGTTGIAVPVKTERTFSIFVSVALLKFSTVELSQDYLCHLINSPFVRQQSKDNTQGIGNQNLVLRLINGFALPIPPLAEQHRIVAKLDELMVLCDRLEKKLAGGDDTRRRLLDALLHEVVVTGADRKSVA